MENQKWLPGKLVDRVQDLCKSRKITQAALADAIDVDRSKLSRFISGKTDSLTDEDVIRIARYFNVSTDFLLGETDEPDRKNYDIGELGLTIQAARNLYSGKVNSKILCQILEHERCGDLMQKIAVYEDGLLTSGIAAENQLLGSLAGILTGQAKAFPEDRAAAASAIPVLQSLQVSTYTGETDAIMKSFGGIVRDIKKAAPDNEAQAARLTKETMAELYAGMQKSSQRMDLHQITPELVVNSILAQLNLGEVPTALQPEMEAILQHLREDLTGYFTILQKAKELTDDQ